MIPILSTDAARMRSNSPKTFTIDTAKTCYMHNMKDISAAEWQKKAECKQEDGATYDGRGCKASVPRIDANSVREPVRHRRPELVSLDLRKHE